jgi:uncharacterized protein
MVILITGGTGLIGRGLVRALDERGDETIVVSRRRGRGVIEWSGVGAAVERADAIVHLAGEPIADARWTPKRFERIRASRVDTTGSIARAVADARRRPRVVVSASAVGVYGMFGPEAPPVAEDAPPGRDPLALVCVDWERAADPIRAAGVRVVHPRFGVVLAAGGGAVAKMAPAFRWFVGGPVGSGAQWVSWIHERDAVRALLHAIDGDALSGAVNVVAPRPVTMNDFARALARALHRPSALRVPALALRALLGEGVASVLLTGQRALPTKLLAAGFSFEVPDIDEAMRRVAADLR